MSVMSTISLIAGTLTTGLMAGLFAGFSYAVMPGLHRSSDRAFVEVMQKINVAIVNPVFMLSFLGCLGFTVVAAVLHWHGPGRSALPWIIAGASLALLMLIITSAVSVPLNNHLAAAGLSGDQAAVAAARKSFEAPWVAWNIVRAVVCVAAFGCLAWALVLHGKASVTPDTAARAATAPAAQWKQVAPSVQRPLQQPYQPAGHQVGQPIGQQVAPRPYQQAFRQAPSTW